MPAGIRITLSLATLVACTGRDPVDIDAGSSGPDAGPAVDAPPMIEELPPLGDGLGTLSGASVAGRIDGVRGIARFSNPVNVATDGAGGVVVCDFDNSVLRRVDAAGVASSPFTVPTGFARPFGLVRTGDTLYVQTDRSTTGTPTGALWRVNLATNTATLVRDNFGRFRGLGILSDGRLVGAEYLQHVVSTIDPATGIATVLATGFNTPYDLVVTPDDDIIVADFGNAAIRKVSLDGNVVTLAGTGFTSPQGLARASDGRIFVSDPGAAKVFVIATDNTVSTVAGTGTPGYRDADNPLEAQLFGLEGIDSDGEFVYVADGTGGEDQPYHRIRRFRH